MLPIKRLHVPQTPLEDSSSLEMLVLMCSLVKYPFASLQERILFLLLLPFSPSEGRWAFLETTAVMLHGRGACNVIRSQRVILGQPTHPAGANIHICGKQVYCKLDLLFPFLMAWLCEFEETESAPDVMASYPSDHWRYLEVSADSRFLSGRAGSCYCPADNLFLLWIFDLWEVL